MSSSKRQTFMVAAICALISLFAGQVEMIHRSDTYFYNLALRAVQGTKQSDAPLALVMIDDQTLARFKEPPLLWTDRLAKVINTLSEAGARVVAIDMVPSVSMDQHSPGMDQKLMEAMAKAGRGGAMIVFGYSEENLEYLPPHEKFSGLSAALGNIDLYPSPGGAVREYILCRTLEDGTRAQSLAYAAARAFSGQPAGLEDESPDSIWTCPAEGNRILLDYRRVLPPESRMSFIDVFDAEETGALRPLAANVKGKIVFIGATTRRLARMWPSHGNPYDPSLSMIPEVVAHLHGAESFFSSNSLKQSTAFNWTLASVITGLASAGVILGLAPLNALGILALFFLGWTLGALWSFGDGSVVPFWPLLAGMGPSIPIAGLYVYITEYRIRRNLSHLFKSYVNQEVLDKILQNPSSVDFKGKVVFATVMFADIRGFTAISEQIEPRVVVEGLNTYFTEMTRAISLSGGYVNKYMGDGILAIFGAPDYSPHEGALAGVWGAVKMLKAVDRLNKSGLPRGFPKIKIGIGIHSGEAIVGNIGCMQKMDYSIIGDTVNTASRIEELTKEYGIPLLMSESAYIQIKGVAEVVHVGSTNIRGKSKPEAIYALKSTLERMENIARLDLGRRYRS